MGAPRVTMGAPRVPEGGGPSAPAAEGAVTGVAAPHPGEAASAMA